MERWLIMPIVGLAILLPLGITLAYIGIHDEDLRLKNTVDSISCDYLINNFMPNQEEMYIKHPWFPYAVDKIENECEIEP